MSDRSLSTEVRNRNVMGPTAGFYMDYAIPLALLETVAQSPGVHLDFTLPTSGEIVTGAHVIQTQCPPATARCCAA